MFIKIQLYLTLIFFSGSVTTAMFISSLPVITDRDYVCTYPVQAFQKQIRSIENQGVVVTKLRKTMAKVDLKMPDETEIEKMLEHLKNEVSLFFKLSFFVDCFFKSYFFRKKSPTKRNPRFNPLSPTRYKTPKKTSRILKNR